MSGVDRALVWRGGQLVDSASAPLDLLVADSWLVEDGHVRGLREHRGRFLAACAAHGVTPVALAGFWRAAVRALPRRGAWFPRVELDERHRLRLLLRPAPPRGGELRVWVADTADPRVAPRTKGPDIDRLAALRVDAARRGAHEVLLTTPSGLVLEGATTSLLWWEGDALCGTDPRLPVLPGVTATLLRRAVFDSGSRVFYRRAPLAELEDKEVWLVNALHGIRPVTGWLGAAVRAGRGERAGEWQRWWDGTARPLPADLGPDPSPVVIGDR